ncbi:MAG: proline iminopeptidase-family hydrolase [Candidatus Eremiobacteraeota bacterium]|nr:proline iminopeptidase-family hydrolase [Candidatus Eremiobacteraeota bacterium]
MFARRLLAAGFVIALALTAPSNRLAAAAACHCPDRHDAYVREGYIPVEGGRVWYRIVGNGPGTPLLLLHGGPGAPSYYLESLAVLADERPVIFYDQLGAGRSDRPNDPRLWTVRRFTRELAQVRTALHLRRVHLLGHSWGAQLAVEHALTGATGIRSMTLAGPSLSLPLWLKAAARLRMQLPASVRATLARSEKAGTTASKAYQDAVNVYYGKHLSLTNPPPSAAVNTNANFGEQVYATMWGPSEFYATGSLKTYDVTSRLHELRMPVLFTCGRFDEATPAMVASFQRLVPHARLAVFEHSAHLTMIDEPVHYASTVRAFLHDADAQPR